MKKYGISNIPQSLPGTKTGKSKMVRNKKPNHNNKPQNTENKDVKTTTEKNDEEVKENWDDDDNEKKRNGKES